MRIGVQLSAFAAPGADARVRLRELDEQVSVAEEFGYSQISLGHHYLTKSAFFQPQSLLAYVAGRTSEIRLGFGVLLLPLLAPVALAEELATLDVISGGRLTVGVGAGYRAAEFAAMGIPKDARYRRLEDGVRLMRQLWSGDGVTWRGEGGRLDGATLHMRPVQAGGPPIWLGALGERGLRRVVELDVSWVANVDGDDGYLAGQVRFLRSALAAAGVDHDRHYAAIRDASIAPTRAAALARARKHALPTFQTDQSGVTAGLDADALVEARCLLGDPDSVLERLRRWHTELGITDVILRIDWGTQSHEEIVAAMRFAGEQVVAEAARF